MKKADTGLASDSDQVGRRSSIDVKRRFGWATTLRHKIKPSDCLPGNRHGSATGVPIDQSSTASG
jgi:hypothetical protein